jgi:hypothetical protein
MKAYELTPENRQKERDNIRHILLSNKYNDSIDNFNKDRGQKQGNQRHKWAKFTYSGKETRFITKMFKDTDVKIAFTTENTIEKRLAIKQETPQNTYDRSGIYQLTCPECKLKYTGQTGRPFKVRFQKHLSGFKYNNNKFNSPNILDKKHPMGTMEDIMDVVHITKKGRMMNALENFHIYKETKPTTRSTAD